MKTNNAQNANQVAHGSLKSYTTGFALSVVMTLAAYLLVSNYASLQLSVFTQNTLVTMIVGLALFQFAVQLIFFLHVSRESKPRWNLTALIFMVFIVSILVFGSLWIMHNLDYNHAQPGAQVDTFIIQDEGIRR